MEIWLGLAQTALRAVQPGLPEMDAVRCLPARHRSSSCTACRDVCRRAALGREAVPRPDADACDGCGACVGVCPTSALASSVLANAIDSWLASIAAASSGAAVVRCERACKPDGSFADRPAPELILPCLAALRSADIVAAAARGAHDLAVCTLECAFCDRASTGGATSEAIDVARVALSALGVPGVVRRVTTTGPNGEGAPADTARQDRSDVMSRRGFFTRWRNTTRRAAVEVMRDMESPASHVVGHRAVPSWRERLEIDIWTLAARSGEGAELLSVELGIGLPSVEGTCDGCGLCALVCPFLALSVSEAGVDCKLAACTACGLCVDVCPTDGLVLRQVEPRAVPAANPPRWEWQLPGASASEPGLAARAAAGDRRMKAAALHPVVRPPGSAR
jgi:formate hydrogenlyase subunit 6/NADH:ubiquinone oxidoreductase subunit I